MPLYFFVAISTSLSSQIIHLFPPPNSPGANAWVHREAGAFPCRSGATRCLAFCNSYFAVIYAFYHVKRRPLSSTKLLVPILRLRGRRQQTQLPHDRCHVVVV